MSYLSVHDLHSVKKKIENLAQKTPRPNKQNIYIFLNAYLFLMTTLPLFFLTTIASYYYPMAESEGVGV